MTLNKIFEQLEKDEQNMIENRHHLHEHPEVSFEEKETSKYIKDFYQKLDMEVKSCGDGYGIDCRY